jgi:hypothetical protein
MSVSICQKKRWGGARFDDRLDAQDGNQRVFRILAAIAVFHPIAFAKLLTPSAGVCILILAIFSRWPRGKLPGNEICNTIKIPLDFFNCWHTWSFENPIESRGG